MQSSVILEERAMNFYAFLSTNEPIFAMIGALVGIMGLAIAIHNSRASKKVIIAVISIPIILFLLVTLIAWLVWNSPQNIYVQATSGNPLLTDPLTDNDGNNWGTSPSYCQFTAGTYHASVAQKGYQSYCAASATNFSNFAYQVQMTIIEGDEGCLIFRYSSANNNPDYAFCISSTGKYKFTLFRPNADYYDILQTGSNSAISAGLNQISLVTVIALGANFYLYVNAQIVLSTNDNTLSYGSIGVGALSDGNSTDVVFSNAKVWVLS